MKILVGIGQFVAGYILGFVLVYALSIGNGAELYAIPFGMALGVWGVGALAHAKNRSAMSFVSTLIGAGVGSALMGTVFSGKLGFGGILLPMAGSLIGYWCSGAATSAKK